MSLDVIGAGFGRTGTLSLKLALEQLGYQKTYHMMELIQNPDHLPVWESALAGENVNWSQLFAGYRATVDWPCSAYWQHLADYYPNAQVILSVRDPEKWFDSIHNTIYPGSLKACDSSDLYMRQWAHWGFKLIWDGVFGGRIEDKAYAISVYQANIDKVRNTISPERLLIFEAGDGWKPLCEFLDCNIPDQSYPRVNTTEDFNAR